MIIGKTLYVIKRADWRKWLKHYHRTEKEIWLTYYRKETGKPRISYNDAVEEALCFGWIDSILKKIDNERFAQRFSIRQKTSQLSEMNRQRILKLISQKKMTKVGLSAIAHAFNAEEQKTNNFKISDDILKLLKENNETWKNFQLLPENYKRLRIAYIENSRRHGKEMFHKSVRRFIELTAKNKRYGFVKEML